MEGKESWSVLLVAGLLMAPGHAMAERIYTVGTSVSAIGSADNNPQVNGVSLGPSQEDLFLTYGLQSAVRLNSRGPDSNLDLSYSFGLNRFSSDLDLGSESHTFEGGMTSRLTRNLSLTFSDSFTRSPDFTTTNLFRGVLFTPEGIFFDVDTVSLRRNSYSNQASIGFDYSLSSRTVLDFGMAHSLRTFEADPAFGVGLSDQNSLDAHFGFTRVLSRRTNLGLTYSVAEHRFEEFQSARNHNARFDLNREISPTVSLRLSVGPSYVQSLGEFPNYLGYVGSLSLSKVLEDNLLSLSYRRFTGNSTGLGSISDTHTVQFSFSRPIGQRTILTANLSAYDSQQRLDNPVETRGLSSALLLNFTVTDNLFVSLGGSYNKQEGTQIFQSERSRLWISLVFQVPELLRFSR